jgi:hypothetical protein
VAVRVFVVEEELPVADDRLPQRQKRDGTRVAIELPNGPPSP